MQKSLVLDYKITSKSHEKYLKYEGLVFRLLLGYT